MTETQKRGDFAVDNLQKTQKKVMLDLRVSKGDVNLEIMKQEML